MNNLDHYFFRPDGTRRTSSERNEIYKREGEAAKAADKQRQKDTATKTAEYMATRSDTREAEKRQRELEFNLSNRQQPTKSKAEVFADHIASLKQQLTHAPSWERGPIERRILMFSDALETEQKKIDTQAKVDTVADSDLLRNAREHAQAYLRTPPDEAERSAAIALNSFISKQFQTSEERDAALSMYWTGVSESMARATQRLESAIAAKQEEIGPAAQDIGVMKLKLKSLKGEAQESDPSDSKLLGPDRNRGLMLTEKMVDAEHKFDHSPYVPPTKPDPSSAAQLPSE